MKPTLKKILQYLTSLCIIMCSYKYGRTALMNAALRGHLEVVSVLLAAGCDPNLQDEVSTRIGCV